MYTKEELEPRFRCVTSIGAAFKVTRGRSYGPDVHHGGLRCIASQRAHHLPRVNRTSEGSGISPTHSCVQQPGLQGVACKLTSMLPLQCKRNAKQEHRVHLLSEGDAHAVLAAMDSNKDPDRACF